MQFSKNQWRVKCWKYFWFVVLYSCQSFSLKPLRLVACSCINPLQNCVYCPCLWPLLFQNQLEHEGAWLRPSVAAVAPAALRSQSANGGRAHSSLQDKSHVIRVNSLEDCSYSYSLPSLFILAASEIRVEVNLITGSLTTPPLSLDILSSWD